MFKHYFERIQDVHIWPIISLTIFFLFFLGILVWVITVDKNHIDKMKDLPFDDGEGAKNKMDSQS